MRSSRIKWKRSASCHCSRAPEKECSSTVDVPGCNKPQMYFKTPGCRTSGHLENQVAASINLNLGPGECVWYCVEFGIPYQKIIQKAGDMIYVGIGTYHWVQSDGYCANVSWNVAQTDPLQLLASDSITDFNRDLHPSFLSCQRSGRWKRVVVCEDACSAIGSKKWPSLPTQAYAAKEPHCAASYMVHLIAVVEKKIKVEGEKAIPMCIDCARLSNEHQIFPQHRYSMEELIKIFDDYN